MGLGLLLFYLPLYLLLSTFALSKINKPFADASKQQKRYLFIGFITSTMVTWYLMWLVPLDTSGGIVGMVFRIALTLIAPAFFLIILNIIKLVPSINKNGGYKDYISGVFYSIIAMPWLSLFLSNFYYDIVNFPAYYELCTKSKIVFKSEIKPASSVFLYPDKFTSASKGYQASSRDIGEWLILASSLKYVERLQHDTYFIIRFIMTALNVNSSGVYETMKTVE